MFLAVDFVSATESFNCFDKSSTLLSTVHLVENWIAMFVNMYLLMVGVIVADGWT